MLFFRVSEMEHGSADRPQRRPATFSSRFSYYSERVIFRALVAARDELMGTADLAAVQIDHRERLVRRVAPPVSRAVRSLFVTLFVDQRMSVNGPREPQRCNRAVWYAFRQEKVPMRTTTAGALHPHNRVHGEATPLIFINAAMSVFKSRGCVAC